MEASQHSLLAACFTLHSINATLAIVPQRGAGLWIALKFTLYEFLLPTNKTQLNLNIYLRSSGYFENSACHLKVCPSPVYRAQQDWQQVVGRKYP
jgi:hypothetical protein